MNVCFSVILLAQSVFAPLFNAPQWIGTRPSVASYTGKVVIVDIFTFDCINCKHVVPELRSLRARYPTKDLLIVGIHTPETPFEHVRASVVQALAMQGISWPVAIDNDEKLWNAYSTQYWPTQLIFDRHGRLRKTVIGEGQDDEVTSTVAALAAER
ncbi:MAG TPA: redoxin domain-containing protein [Candidatus Binatia bacterium]|nr:redoxin domain-containing protein [Candidatus Binatia bacterium]